MIASERTGPFTGFFSCEGDDVSSRGMHSFGMMIAPSYVQERCVSGKSAPGQSIFKKVQTPVQWQVKEGESIAGTHSSII